MVTHEEYFKSEGHHMRGCPEDDSILGELDKYGYA